jgi:hypothetical protein
MTRLAFLEALAKLQGHVALLVHEEVFADLEASSTELALHAWRDDPVYAKQFLAALEELVAQAATLADVSTLVFDLRELVERGQVGKA